MVFALLFSEAEKEGRGKNGEARKALVTWGLNSECVRRARAVLRQGPQLADGVIAGQPCARERRNALGGGRLGLHGCVEADVAAQRHGDAGGVLDQIGRDWRGSSLLFLKQSSRARGRA